MDPIDFFLHVANILYAVSYSVRKILWLRAISVVAGVSMISYFYFRPVPLWIPLYWSLGFVLLNSFHVGLLIYERRPLNFSDDERRLFQMVFRTLTPWEFKKLLDRAVWKEVAPQSILVSKNQQLERMSLIFSGVVSIEIDGKSVAQLRDGQFIGEMGFLTGDIASADAIALQGTKYISWDMKDLRSFLGNNLNLQSAMQMVIGADLVNKLKKK
jgi:hypothetical protein